MSQCITRLFCAFLTFIPLVYGTYRYYFSFLPYGSGDTMITTFHNHGGPVVPHRKWYIECLDGEAMVGIQDFFDDFERLENVWCKFTFPYKPPSNGRYPYYPDCVVRNMTDRYFCFDAKSPSTSINTFVTAVWDNEYNFYLYRPGGYNTILGDDLQPYKCCKTPPGYYIDYVSCYYIPTHDEYYEFYDSLNHIMTMCAEGYVITGIAKKLTPFEQEYHMDWMQCCRVGYGVRTALSPPVIYGNGGDRRPAYHASELAPRADIPEAYKEQYRMGLPLSARENQSWMDAGSAKYHDWNSIRYIDDPTPAAMSPPRKSEGGFDMKPQNFIVRSTVGQ